MRVSMGETVVLVTACARQTPTPGRDFFPLTVNYIEKTYAAGRIPGGFFKREGRPTEKETLTSRLIDRPIRPLFPDGFHNDVQVVATVLSMDPDIDADIPALLGASAALALSGIPFNGPIGAARVGWQDGRYLLNPTAKDLHAVAAAPGGGGHRARGAHGGVGSEGTVGRGDARRRGVRPRADAGGHPRHPRTRRRGRQAALELAAAADERRADERRDAARAGGAGAGLQHHREAAAPRALGEIKTQTLATLAGGDSPKWSAEAVESALFKLESNIVRQRILNGEPRIDGRDTRTVRPITVKVGVLPRTHGSALFTRGETQAMVVTTLGTTRDAQIIDALEGERREPFMLHYNFPPFSVGETGMMGSPKRREIGHGNLARRGVKAVMPDMTTFPYVIRVVSEILESNGSSSMASVCGTSLALMDAGVPIKAPVAGVAMGLVLEGNRYQGAHRYPR